MTTPRKPAKRKSRSSKNVFVTRSGKSIKINRSLGEKWRARKDERSRRKAAYLSTLPTNRIKRFFVRLHPRRLAKYWFSREGALMALKVTGIGIVLIFLLLIGMFAYFRKDLPNLKDISGSQLGGSISYYDSSGSVLLFQDYNAVKRIIVPSNQISAYMKDATVSIEDKNFYHEGAFDVRGILRAGFHDLFSSSQGLQGGSTITQQLVKLNENWSDNRTVTRKVKEIILAVELEREYSKEDILTGYLNIAPYGGILYGAEAAAEDYFNTTASQLTLPQAAMLSAIPQSPDIYSPNSPDFDKSAFLSRYDYVLDQMASQGYITKAQDKAAQAVDVISEVQPVQSKYSNIKAPYFVLAAKNQLQNEYGNATVNRGGWKVITTLNMTDQNIVQNYINANIPNISAALADEEASVVEDVPTGQVLAEVGGTDFNNPDHGQINYAQTNIPPGSSFKPYDYSTLINDTTDVGAGSLLYDVQEPLPGYPCTNKTLPAPRGNGNCLEDYDFIYPGAEEIRYALAGSRNVPAVKAMLSVIPGNVTASVNKVISTANSLMGTPNAYQCYSDTALTQSTQCYGSSAIGDGAFLHLDQHVNGLSSLARMGQEIPQTYIKQIVDSSGKTLYQWTQPTPTQIIKTDSAYIVDNMLSDPNASYLPGSCSAFTCTALSRGGYKFQHYNGWDIAVKTGTTNNGFDGLMMSWSTQLAVGSWVGNHTRNVDLRTSAFEYLTEPLTRNIMQATTDALNMKPVNWVQPSDIKVLPSFVQRTHIHYGDIEPGPSTDIFPAWYVAPTNKGGTSQTIDKVSGGIATSCTPPLAKQTVNNANESAFSADIFWPIGNSSSTSTGSTTLMDTVHQCGEPPPAVTVQPLLSSDCDVQNGCSFTITVSQQPGGHPLNDPQYAQYPGTVNLQANGQTVATDTSLTGCSTSGGNQSCSFTMSFVPPASDACTLVNISAQAIDSVLEEGTSPSGTSVTPKGPPGNSTC